jgi:putative ABC transport system ATP-binding protein
MSVRVENMRHTYTAAGLEPRTVLQIDAWTLGNGEQALLRGISGSGKTTLMNIVAGLLRPTLGQVWLDDQSLFALGEAARDRFRTQHIGYVFQTHHLLPMLSARENVEMPMAFANVLSARQRRARATELLAAVGLDQSTNHHPHQLSTGQRLRVAVARAVANAPRVVLADEPTAALDQAAGHTVLDLLQHTCHVHGSALLVASHDPALAARFDQVWDLEHGQMRQANAASKPHTRTMNMATHETIETFIAPR